MLVVCATRSEASKVNALTLGGRETNGGLVNRSIGERTQIIHDEFSVLRDLFFSPRLSYLLVYALLFLWPSFAITPGLYYPGLGNITDSF